MKTDLKKEFGAYTATRGRFDLVTLAPLRYLMIDGHGDPNTAARYRDALQTLYPVAYAAKFLSKRALDRDYTVPPLEALWWADDMAAFTTARDKSQWDWTLLNLLPDWITDAHLEEARATVAAKGSAPLLDELRVETLDEGLCAQTLHLGPYDDEAPVLDELHYTFIPGSGLRMTGRHHEVYLSDPRRAAPEKLRTILRQPVERVDA
jgi:hypothetical protein